MKRSLKIKIAGAVCLICSSSPTWADTLYVDVNNPSPSAPYDSWATAANDIQSAVYAASDGDTVFIEDGTYNISSEIYIGKNQTIRSVNGPEAVKVDAGRQSRVFYLRSNNGSITLDGLTVTGGFTAGGDGGGIYSRGPNPIEIIDCIIEDNEAEGAHGGGVYGFSSNTVLDRCIIRNNVAGRNGGGMYRVTAKNCVISHNSADSGGGLANSTTHNCYVENNTVARFGGGISGGTAKNCVISGNSAFVGGGIFGSTIYNCTVTGNIGRVGGGMSGGSAHNSICWYNIGATDRQDMNNVDATYCSSPDVEHGLSGNITNMPLLVSTSHIASDSLCLAAGDQFIATGTDLDGQPWLTPPSMGCDEFHGAGSVTGTVAVAIGGAGNVTEDFPSDLFADIDGQVYSHVWDFGDGTTETNCLIPRHVWEVQGIYDVKLTAYSDSYPGGISATQAIHVVSLDEATLYVDVTTGNDSNNGLDWANAKRSINDAVESHCYFGGRVLVTNGIYGSAEGIVVDKSLLVESVNGPEETIIDGNVADLCVYLGPGCTLRGFSVRNGIGGIQGFASSIVDSCWVYENFGTGIWGGNVYDSVIRNNINTFDIGGGLDDANAYNCLVVSNSARIGGGIDMSGGNDGEVAGAYEAVNCVVSDNSAEYGGGILGGEARNCVVSGNTAEFGGGIHKTTALNCTIVGNTAEVVGGANESSVYSSIVYSNASSGAYPEISEDSFATHSCSPGLTNGVDGNINTDPLFIDPVSGDFRLSATSPCIDAGINGYVLSTLDLDGNQRIMDGDFDGYPVVDMGAYEFQTICVVIDIKPGSDTNPINMKSKGRVPVAVMGSDEFDVVAINIDSIRFAGAAPVHMACEDVDVDGCPDLILHFNTQELNLQNESTFAMLLGQTHERVLLGGSDSIKIVPRKK